MDDVYQEDSITNDFEKFMANLTGKEDSLLVMSDTMGNQIPPIAVDTTAPRRSLSLPISYSEVRGRRLLISVSGTICSRASQRTDSI